MSDNSIRVASIRTADTAAELQEFSEGDWVKYGDGEYGVVVSKMTEDFEWPSENVPTEAQAEVGEDEEVSEGSTKLNASDETIYVVARASGGSQPFHASDLNESSSDEAVGELPDEVDPMEDVDDAELAAIYSMVDDPFDYEEFTNVVAELQNIPGVDDPEVGWNDWPDSWKESEKPARLIFLDMWSTVGGTFTTCRARFAGRISRPSRFCAASKDEALGTELWRNRF